MLDQIVIYHPMQLLLLQPYPAPLGWRYVLQPHYGLRRLVPLAVANPCGVYQLAVGLRAALLLDSFDLGRGRGGGPFTRGGIFLSIRCTWWWAFTSATLHILCMGLAS
jgi:hypothetical protein